MSKLFYSSFNFNVKEINLQRLFKVSLKLELNALDTIKIHESNYLLLPGTHDFIAGISETYCILLHLEKSLNTSLEMSIRNKLIELMNSNLEYSMNLQRGCIRYMKKLNYSLKNSIVMENMASLFKEKATESIIKSNEINNILNLKLSCELLTILVIEGFSNLLIDNIQSFWKNLLECCKEQIEYFKICFF